MVGAFQTYPITISRLQVIFIAIRIQVIFTSNKCIDDASPCNDVDYDIEGGRYYDRIPVVLPGRDDCVIYSDTGSCAQFILRMGSTMWHCDDLMAAWRRRNPWQNVTVFGPQDTLVSHTMSHSAGTPRHTCHTFPPTWSQTLDGHLPNLYLETADIFAWCFSEILGFHLLAIFCIYLYGERVWTRWRRIGIMKRRKGQKAQNSDQSSFEQSKRLVQSKLKRQSLEEGTL